MQLLRERGAAGVTVDAVLAHSAAPRGSVYHHFPGGRDELILGAVRAAGDFIGALVDETPADGDPRRELERFVRFWQQALADNDFRAGCPVVALVVDSRLDSPEATRLVREIFTRWRATMLPPVTRLPSAVQGLGMPAAQCQTLHAMRRRYGSCFTATPPATQGCFECIFHSEQP